MTQATQLSTDFIVSDSRQLTPKFAKIAASSSGNNTVVAAVAGKKIRVLGYHLVSSGTVTAKFQSAASGTDLTGGMTLAAQTTVSAECIPVGLFETVAGELLNINLSGATAVNGALTYIEV